MKAILLDLDGVLYVADQAIPGADTTLAWVRGQAIPHLFVTNTTSRPRSAVAARLGGMGIVISPGELITPAVAAASWLQEQSVGPIALFVPKATRAEFEGLDILPEHAQTGARAVVIGDMGSDWSYDRMNRAFRLLMGEKVALIALGMTRYWQASDGLRLDTGAIVSALTYACSIVPRVFGKPDQVFFDAAVQRLDVPAQDVMMVGDDIVGDVQGAQRAGLKTALVKTGKFRSGDLDLGIEPDLILESIAALPTAWPKMHPS